MILSIGMPSTSLASIANAVWWPCPCTLVPANTVARAVVVDLDRAELDVQTDRRGDLDVGRHADAELLDVAGGTTLGLFGPQLGVAGRREHRVERLLVLARVVVGAGRRRQRERGRLDEVDAPDLGRVHADLVGGDVEHALDQLRRLGSAGAAVRADRGVVGHDAGRLEPHLGDFVHADRHHLREHRQDRADRRIRTGRGDHVAVEADDLAVVRDAELGRHHEVATVHERDHVLGPRLGPLHRTVERQRDLGRDEMLDVARGLRTEATADPRAHDAQLRRIEPEHRRVGAVDRVRRLVRHPEREPAVVGDGDDAVGLHRHAGEALAHHRDLGDHVGARRADPSSWPKSVPKHTFEPCSGNSSGASGAKPAIGVLTTGSGS